MTRTKPWCPASVITLEVTADTVPSSLAMVMVILEAVAALVRANATSTCCPTARTDAVVAIEPASTVVADVRASTVEISLGPATVIDVGLTALNVPRTSLGALMTILSAFSVVWLEPTTPDALIVEPTRTALSVVAVPPSL